MKTLNSYLRLPHLADCACSVCWSQHQMVSRAPCPSIPCEQCRPAKLVQLDGRWYCQPVSFCAKHTPPRRPAKYWNVVQDTGKPTPFVPLWDFWHDA
ncbi:MAG: DUF5447 family protein [Pseudomonadaceae bacterium]|nr:DUF5447 family protein [Pseudomonadaceae bacterium]